MNPTPKRKVVRKTSDTVRSLLRKYDLDKAELRDFASVVAALPDYSVVNEEASDLILSLVADDVGSRAGLRTVTERQIDFAVNSLTHSRRNGRKDCCCRYVGLCDVKSRRNSVCGPGCL